MLNGKTLNASCEDGTAMLDDSFLILVNAAAEGVDFNLPKPPNGGPWRIVLDTQSRDDPFAVSEPVEKVITGGRSLVLLSDAVPKPV